MNKLKMAAVQERLKLKRVQIDTWTTSEKLCLASAVLRSGDQNWVSVSRTLRAFDELNRPPDWFSQKNCALQYSSLLEKVDTPKRKRGERGEVHVETPGECIVRKLTSERVEELKKSIEKKRFLYHKLQEEISLVRSGQADDKLDDMLQDIEEEKRQKQREAEIHAKWLKEREEKLQEIKRAWKPPGTSSVSGTGLSPLTQRDSESGNRRSSNQSEQSSEAESLVDSPLSEPIQVDIIGDESMEGQVETKPSSPVRESSPQPNTSAQPATSTPSTPTSPLLTSLLKSPSQAPSLQASSILHSAITAQRGSSPTITSLLNSSPGIPVSGTGATSPVSSGIKAVVTTSTTTVASEEHSEKPQPPAQPTTSPSAGAPTLSMLLELPPSLPGKPLPEIPTLTPKVPSTPQKENALASPVHSPLGSPTPAEAPKLEQEEIRVPETVKEDEEKEKEIVPSQEQNPTTEIKEKTDEVHNHIKEEVIEETPDTPISQPEKPEDVSSPSETEKKSDIISNEAPAVEEEKLQTTELGTENEETKEQSAKKSESEAFEESLEKTESDKAEDNESASEKKPLSDVPPSILPEETEAQEVPSQEKSEVIPEVNRKTQVLEKVLSSEADDKNVKKDGSPSEEPAKDNNDLPAPSLSEEVVEKTENKVEEPTILDKETKPDEEEEKKTQQKVLEAAEDEVKEETKVTEVIESVVVDESSLPEPALPIKKDENVLESATEEDDMVDKTLDTTVSGSESGTPDSQLKKRGGSRGRKRGRGYRMRQEKKAKEKIEKEKEEPVTVQEGDSENNVSELVDAVRKASEDVIEEDKTEKEIIVSKNEVSHAEEKQADTHDQDTIEVSKRETGASQKKTKTKKTDEVSDDSKKKEVDVQSVSKVSVESEKENVDELKKTQVNRIENVTEVSIERQEPLSKENEDDRPLIELKVSKEKKNEKENEEKQDVKGPDKEKEIITPEHVDERKADDKKQLDRKTEIKSKHVPSDKKIDEKERRKSKDIRSEKKDKKTIVEKVDEIVSKEDIALAKEDEKKSDKEKRLESRDRKSLSEKKVETVEKKRVADKKSEEEEKVVGDKKTPEKSVKEVEVKKLEGERKTTRERKYEEKEKKVIVEKKVEESKRKPADEKKTEETEIPKSPDRETSVSSKRSSSIQSPDRRKPSPVSPIPDVSTTEKTKRKIDSVEGESSEKNTPEAKQRRRSNDPSSVAHGGDSEKETSESDKKTEEESVGKRKFDRRKGVLSKRNELEESASKGGQSAASSDEKEKTSDVDSTPKIGRRRGGGSSSANSAPGTPMDQIPSSPASSQSLTEEEREYRAWKKAILLVWSRLATHKFASIFLRPITNDQAPGYHNVVFRPIDLYTIKKNVENGVIRTTAHFQRDVMLMFLNAIMYNSSDHDVHRMSVQMQQESIQHIQILLEASEAPKILRRETREGNKRSDSSSQLHVTPITSHDEAFSSAGVTASSSSTHTPAAENVPGSTSEEEISESESQISYITPRQKVGDTGDFSARFQKNTLRESSKKKNLEEDGYPETHGNNNATIDDGSTPENSSSSENEDERMEEPRRLAPRSYLSKTKVIKKVKDRKQMSAASPDPDADLAEEHLSSSQFGDHEQYVDEIDKKQIRGVKRSINDCLISSEDSCSLPDDSSYWPNVMSMKADKADDTESVSSSVYKRRRVQRKSINSDHDSLIEAPNFPFSPNSASLDESDYQAWKRLVLLIWDQIADHEFATIFMTPVRTDEAPRYYNVVSRPMDLGTIRKNVEKGVIRTISHFQRDVFLMFANAIMYNPSHHDVHHKTAQMQKDCLQYLEVLVQESSEDPEIFRHEIRESNNKIHSTGLDDIITASKSESSSTEDQLSGSQTSGKVLETHNSSEFPYLKGNLSILNEKDSRISISNNSTVTMKSSPAFSTRKRTAACDSL